MRRVVLPIAAALVLSTGIVLLGLYVVSSAGAMPQQQPTLAKPPQSSVPPSSKHVFLIMMENKTFDEALQGNYTASLASKYALATNYHAITHPSLPNYLALTSGSTWGIKGDDYQALPRGEDLGSELTSAGVSWRAYMENMTNGCLDSSEPYKLGHNPFAFYCGQCPSNVVPLSQLDADLSGGDTPNFVWITPNLCHDEHNCSVSTGDQWLAEIVPKIMDSAAWKNDGVLFVTWDEDDQPSGSNRVPLIMVAPALKERQTDIYYDHYSLLATIEDRLGVPRLREAVKAQAIEL